MNNNSKSGQIMYMNLIPVTLIVVLIIGAGYLMTKGDFKLPFFGNNLEIRRFENFPTTITTQKQFGKQRVVIKSQEELDRFLANLDSAGLVKITEAINFDKEYVLGAATQTFDKEGYDLKIRRVYKDKDSGKVLVSLKERRPGESCKNLEAVNNVAVDIVAISKTDKEISFDVAKETYECD